MRSQAARLPSRFPVGTRYVIEGRAGRIQLRYLEFPDGRQVKLPSEPAGQSRVGNGRQRVRPASRKFRAGRGTKLQIQG
jgi:hypothetical protein